MQAWVGKRVTLGPETVNFGGKGVAGIRIYPADGTATAPSGSKAVPAFEDDADAAQDEPEAPPF